MTDAIVAHKACNRCREEKPLSEFRTRPYKDRRFNVGRCRLCENRANRVGRGTDLPLPKPSNGICPITEQHKRCNYCKKVKPLSGFWSRLRRPTNAANGCRQCLSQRQNSKKPNSTTLPSVRKIVWLICPVVEKVCTHCQTIKPLAEFRGKYGTCRTCEDGINRRNRSTERAKAVQKEWKRTHPYTTEQKEGIYKRRMASGKQQTHNRKTRLRKNYGITPFDYCAMFFRQGGVCAICQDADAGKLGVDHCHATGRVRGLLCNHCNFAIGLLHDNPVYMERAKGYIESPFVI